METFVLSWFSSRSNKACGFFFLSFSPEQMLHEESTPEEMEITPRYVSMRNYSAGAYLSLAWSAKPLTVMPPSTVLLAANPAPPASCRRPTRKRFNAAANETGRAKEDAVIASNPEMLSPRRGVRSLECVRQFSGCPNLLSPQIKDDFDFENFRKHKPSVLWEWQRHGFDLRNTEDTDDRSRLQVSQDAKRNEERSRRNAFLKHLREVAIRRPANRIPLREHSSVQVLNNTDLSSPQIFAHQQKSQARVLLPQRPATGKPTSKTVRGSDERPLSARVRQRIDELAKKYLKNDG